MNRPNGDSIWGNINTCVEIALNVYEICAKHGDGIMVRKDAETPISQKALALGTDNGEYITFDDTKKDIPMYEVLKQQLAQSQLQQEEIIAKIKEIERDGKYRYPEYFGELAKPDHITEEIRRGIYMTADKNGELFAVHEAVAEDYMTEMAIDTGIKQGEYVLYNIHTAAIPIFELAKSFTEVEAMVIAKDSLYATLTNNFTAYTEEYNELSTLAENHIPVVDAPMNLYLSSQIKEATSHLHLVDMTQEQFNEYGEEVNDFGFEP